MEYHLNKPNWQRGDSNLSVNSLDIHYTIRFPLHQRVNISLANKIELFQYSFLKLEE